MNNIDFSALHSRVDNALMQLLTEAVIPATHIKKAMIYSLFPGGKRIRPLLVYLIGQLLSIDESSLDAMACAIELTHGYSLIHDDLPAMDNDDFRRGKPSCHRAFDEATAILAGDGLQALAVEHLLTVLPTRLANEHVITITKALVSASGTGGMISGQGLDLSELSTHNVSLETLHHIHRLKTGRLIVASIEMPLLAANIMQEQFDALIQFGQHLGMVFQIQDDYLDYYGDIKDHGKSRQSDEANGKTTFATHYNQSNLQQLIQQHYQYARDSLTCFNGKAEPLIRLLTQLENRR